MKNLRSICALFVVLAIMFTGCDSPVSGGGGNGNGDSAFSVKGFFKNGGDTSFFTANQSKGKRGVFSRAAGDDTSIPLEGTLDDGDMTFRLKGSYDRETKSYTLSSASTHIRYTINADAAGTPSASIATRSAASEPFDNPVIVAVDSGVTDTAITTNMVNKEPAAVVQGLTETDWYGSWYQNEAEKEMRFLVDEWGLHLSAKDGNTWVEGETLSFAQITDKGDSTYDLVVDLPVVNWEETIEGFEVSFRDYPLYLESIGSLIFDPNEWPSFSKYGGNALVYKEPVYESENAGTKTYSPCISYTNKDSRIQSLDGAINVEGTIVRILHEPKVVSIDWNDDGTYVQNYDYSSPYIIKTCALSELEAAELYFDATWTVHEDRYATIAMMYNILCKPEK